VRVRFEPKGRPFWPEPNLKTLLERRLCPAQALIADREKMKEHHSSDRWSRVERHKIAFKSAAAAASH
jgi:hypothetical protein